MTTAQLNGHTTWYQVEKDISIAKLYCKECDKHFVELIDEPHPCPLCKKEVDLTFDLTHSEIEKVGEVIASLRTRESDDRNGLIEWEAEMSRRLHAYDWWNDSRIQNQCMWIVLRDRPGFEKACQYFESAYVLAYHRDDYIF